MEWVSTSTQDELLQVVSAQIETWVVEQRQHQQPILWLWSGGSSLDIAQAADAAWLQPGDAVTVIDERFDSDPAQRNATKLRQTKFGDLAAAQGVKLIDPVADVEWSSFADRSLEQQLAQMNQVATEFERDLKLWLQGHQTAKIVATLGIGADGHTAGILPFSDDFERREDQFFGDKWIVAYQADQTREHRSRLTTTFSFLQQELDRVVVWVTGEEKQPPLEKLRSSGDTATRSELAAAPCLILPQMSGQVLLATDVLL